MIYAVIFVLSILLTLGIFVNLKKLGIPGVAMGLQALLMTGLGGTLFLFYYLICDRALLSKKTPQPQVEKF